MGAYDSASGTFSDKDFLSVADMQAFRADVLGAVQGAVRAIGWASLPASARQLPLGFVLPGKPAAGATLNLAMGMACAIPANLEGTVAYAGTPPAAGAAFVLNKLPAGGGAAVTLGSLSFAAGTAGAMLSTQPAASLAVGDVLQLASPAAQDATLADIGITILAMRA